VRRVLLLCSTTDGQTRRICERLREQLREAGDDVTLMMIEQAEGVSPAGWDMAVIGARIRYGRTHPVVFDYANRYARELNAMPSAFFSVNVVARKPDKNRPDTNPYVRKFLKKVAWQPKSVDVFAGKIDYPRYNFVDKNIIRFIMWLTKGPTDPQAVVEFTDWRRVEDFGQSLRAA
jgi:menaquinone-dependent protoporphyrinogen oxidase